MEMEGRSVGSPSVVQSSTEERMLKEDVVREVVAQLERREGVKRIARELAVDRETVKAWRAVGGWRARPGGPAPPRTDGMERDRGPSGAASRKGVFAMGKVIECANVDWYRERSQHFSGHLSPNAPPFAARWLT
jgi:hypothetical protein